MYYKYEQKTDGIVTGHKQINKKLLQMEHYDEILLLAVKSYGKNRGTAPFILNVCTI